MLASANRRQFVTAAVAAGVTAGLTASESLANWRRRRIICLPRPHPPCPCPPKPDPGPALHTRPNITSLSSAQLESLKRGVAAMKLLPPTDPRSWTFQAAIHWTNVPPSNSLHNQCQHGTIQFFTWHRGYLYFFERILRWAAQDPALNLPFWDWTAQRVLPEPFRNPADASNPLYESLRQANDGSALPSYAVVDDLNRALDQTAFNTNAGFSDLLEVSPHGTVHGLVGGPGGLMSQVPTAARDPIFWLHHGNVDRLWNVWLNRAGGRANPTDPAFLDRPFAFADESGQTVTVRVREIISSAQLGYQYEGVPSPRLVFATGGQQPDRATPPRVVATSAPDRATPLQQLPAKALEFKPEVVKLEPEKESRPVLMQAFGTAGAGAAKSRVVIAVEGIAADQTPGFLYAVFLNLPEGDLSEEDRRKFYIGSINFFGLTRGEKKAGVHDHGDEFTQTFDATDVVARLQQGKKWNAEAVTVTILPVVSIPPGQKEEQVRTRAAATATKAKVSYKRITIRVTP